MTPKPALTKNRRSGLRIAAMRRWFIYRPLALFLAILLAPAVSWLDAGLGSGPSLFQARAQISSGATCAIPNCILPVPPGPIAFDLVQLERDGVSSYLALRGLPASEASKIYDLGRKDLRNQVRASMFMILAGIIDKPLTQRSAQEQRLYEWLQNLVKLNEIKMYQSAIDHYRAFQADLCNFRLDKDVSDAFGLKFSGAEYCFSSRTLSSVFMPPAPDAKYFLGYGLKQSYGAKALEDPTYAEMFTDSALTSSEIWSVGAASAALGGFLGGTLIVTAITAATTAAAVHASAVAAGTAVFSAAVGTAHSGFMLSSGVASAAGGVIFGVAAPVAIIFIAVLTAVIAGITLGQDVKNREEIESLNATLTQVINSPMDLTAMAKTGGLGSYKLQNSFYSQTLPDRPSTAALPQRQASDLNFNISTGRFGEGGSRLTDTLLYRDWDTNVWTTQSVGGWFVRTACLPVKDKPCQFTDSLIGALRFLDWSGKKWTAMRRDTVWVMTAANPETTRDCALGTADTRNCRSLVTYDLQMQDDKGNPIKVSLTRVGLPTFNDPGPLNFSVGTAATRTFTTTSIPPATITVESAPGIFSFPDGQSGPSIRLSHSNSLFQPVGTFNVTLRATNPIGSVTRTFPVRIDNVLGIVSPSTIRVPGGKPFSFTVVATGLPTPRLTLDATGYDMGGLTFRDNGDGTGTLSGIQSTIFRDQQCLEGACGGFIASNIFGSVKQNFQLVMDFADQAYPSPPQSAVFYPGVPAQFVLGSRGATTPVSWGHVADSRAPWLSFRDNRDGTATLSGTAPYSATGASFELFVAPGALGSSAPILHRFPVSVSDKPFITAPGPATFTVGSPGSFGLKTNLGQITLAGTLPAGLSFVRGNISTCLDCQASIQGTPASGSGGRYTVFVTATAPTGSSTQELPIDVNEAPAFSGPNLAVMFAGRLGSFSVPTSGYPNVGTVPVAANAGPPASPPDGTGPLFTVSGLPSGLTSTNLLQTGVRTGTLIVTGTPSAADVGNRPVQLTVRNGVGGQVQQNFTLQVLPYNPVAPVGLVSVWRLARDASNNVVATIVLANNGSRDAENVVINSVRLNGVTGTASPSQFLSIPAAGSASFRVLFPAASVGAAGAPGTIAVSGVHSGGSINTAGRVVLP